MARSLEGSFDEDDVDVGAGGEVGDDLGDDDQAVGPREVGHQVGTRAADLRHQAAVVAAAQELPLAGRGAQGTDQPGGDVQPVGGGVPEGPAERRPHEDLEGDEGAHRVPGQGHDRDAVEITATARTADRTGVEMEVLTSVAVAGLTMIDMVKAVDPRASITDVRLLAKSGGKSGDWVR